MVTIRKAVFPDDAATVRVLFQEYADGLGIDLGFQDFEAELAGLPGKFAAPRGCVLLADTPGGAIGCVALRPLDAAVCEMKRLFIRRDGRGRQLGSQLVSALIEAAREMRYERMRLDTLPTMLSARRLYETFGFREIAPYIYNPIPGALFLECPLPC